MSTVGAVPCRGKKKESWKEQEVVTESYKGAHQR